MLVTDALESVLRGETKRLMLFAPPQMVGKSELAIVRFVPFWLAHRPEDPVILASYGASLAHAKSWEARNVVESPAYTELFPEVRTDQTSRASEHWRIAGHRGEVIAAGVGGPITGHGALCFPADTKILTEWGELDIQSLVMLQYRPRVWSYDHKNRKLKLCQIVATREAENEGITRIATVGGRSLESTSDHRVYVEGHGYKKATFLRIRDKLITTVSVEQDLQDMRNGEARARTDVPSLLPISAQAQSEAAVCMVWKGNQAAFVRIREGIETRAAELLLQQRVSELSQASPGWESKEMPELWKTDDGVGEEILFKRVSERCTFSSESEEVWMVWYNFPTLEQSDSILFKNLCKCRTLDANEREKQFPLQDRDKLRQMVCRDAAFNSGERWKAMYCVRQGGISQEHPVERASSPTDKLGYSSYQRDCLGQRSRKSDYSMPVVPCKAPQLSSDKVTLVQHLHKREVRVYDLRVEGCHNFFANGILVHNCGIVDDPIENWEQAQSPTVRESIWQWWRSTFRTRIWEDGAIVFVATRWHEDDLAGRLLAEGSEKWKVLRLPALAETQEERDANNQRLGLLTGQPDPLGREPGQPLCPQRFSLEALEEIRGAVGEMVWGAEYQGVPRQPSGERLSTDLFQIVEEVPKEAKRVRYWDKGGRNKTSTYTAGVLMARANGVFYIEDVVRGRWSIGEREDTILETARLDKQEFGRVEITVEQEPGSGGQESADSTTANLAGFIVEADKVSGSKDVRLEPFIAQAQRKNVRLKRARWNYEWLEELCTVPFSRYRDQADATAGAFNKLALGGGGGTLVRVKWPTR